MARKDGSTLKRRKKGAQEATEGQLTLPSMLGAPENWAELPGKPARKRGRGDKSWAALGVDTSMTACSVVGVGYDGTLDKMVGPDYAEIRWTPDVEYFDRLGQAAKGHDLVLDVLKKLWVIRPDRVYIAIEEPWYFGAVKRGVSGWLKQQAEVAGAFKGALAKYGFLNIYEINNSQWAKTLREEGVPLLPQNKKDPDKKWKVKAWAIQAFGLPDLPDLVASKSGAKIIRPASGYGAKAKPVQPSDIYDAAACAAWMMDQIEQELV